MREVGWNWPLTMGRKHGEKKRRRQRGATGAERLQDDAKLLRLAALVIAIIAWVWAWLGASPPVAAAGQGRAAEV